MAITAPQRKAAALVHAGRTLATAAKAAGVELAEVERWSATKTWRAEIVRLARLAEEESVEVKRRGKQLGLRVLARAAAGNLDPGACPTCGRGDLVSERPVSAEVQVQAASTLAGLPVEPLPGAAPAIPETALEAAEQRHQRIRSALERNVTNAAASMAGERQLAAAHRDVMGERAKLRPKRALSPAELTKAAVDGALRLPVQAQEAVYLALGAALGVRPGAGGVQ